MVSSESGGSPLGFGRAGEAGRVVEGGEAALAPAGVGKLLDAVALSGAYRGVAGQQVVEQGLEGGPVLVGEEAKGAASQPGGDKITDTAE